MTPERAAIEFEQGIQRLTKLILGASQATPYTATQLIDHLCAALAADNLSDGAHIARASAAVSAAVTREHVAKEIAAAIWNPATDLELLRRSKGNKFWRGHHSARRTCAEIALEHATKPNGG